MDKYIFYAACYCLAILTMSCEASNPNIDTTSGQDELKALEVEGVFNEDEQNYNDIIYVPIYSDIYVSQQNQKTLLAATLSIRNTSYKDSLFVSKIHYFNTQGELVKEFIDNVISLPPMATVNYVIDTDDDTGGPGANFMVEISSTSKVIKPLIQAIMIGQTGNKGFAFATDGYSVKIKE